MDTHRRDAPRFEISREAYASGRAAVVRRGGYLPHLDLVCQRDESFSIGADGELLFFCPCFVVEGTAGWHDGTSSIPYWAPMDDAARREVARLVAVRVHHLFREGPISRVKLLVDDELDAALSAEFALDDNSRMFGYMDLRLSEQALWSGIRRRYRPHINRGKARLRRVVVTSPSELTAAVRDFIRRSPGMTDYAFWAMLQRLDLSEGAILLFYLDECLLGAVGVAAWKPFSASSDVAYEIGAYDHTLGFPAHFCLFDTARYLGARGTFERFFLIAGSPCVRDTTDPQQAKLAHIDHFKQGLCSHVFIHRYKIIRPSAG